MARATIDGFRATYGRLPDALVAELVDGRLVACEASGTWETTTADLLEP
jgi:hypothetical protein